MGIADFISRLLRRRHTPVKTHSSRTRQADGAWLVDVRGQTCPGYLLDINQHVDAIGTGARITLLISYPPCGDDVRAWCAEKGFTFHGIEPVAGVWEIRIET